MRGNADVNRGLVIVSYGEYGDGDEEVCGVLEVYFDCVCG